MKLLLLLLLAFPVFSQSIENKVRSFENAKDYKVEYDKFQKATTVTLELKVKADKTSRFISASWQSMTAFARIPDAAPPYLALWFTARYSFFNRPTLRLLLDGELMARESDEIDRDVFFTFSPVEFRKIVSANTVELQLESFEGKLDNKSLIKLRNLASLIN